MNGADRDSTPTERAEGNGRAAIGRRALLAGAGGAALADGGAAPVVAGAGPDAGLLAACDAFHAADARVAEWDAARGLDEDAGSAANTDWYAALRRIAALRAGTAAGIRAKIHAAHVALKSAAGAGDLSAEEAVALSALDDLLALAGSAG